MTIRGVTSPVVVESSAFAVVCDVRGLKDIGDGESSGKKATSSEHPGQITRA